MTRTNISLDEALVDRAKRLTGLKTMKDVVNHALRELLRHGRQKDILKLYGNVRWEGDLSAMRRMRAR